MNAQAYALPILAILTIFAVFGGFAFMGVMHHEIACPFMPGHMALCSTSALEHLRHYQSAFASTLVSTFIFIFGFALSLSYAMSLLLPAHLAHERQRTRRHISLQPTLMQELFSRGILNRKEPSLML